MIPALLTLLASIGVVLILRRAAPEAALRGLGVALLAGGGALLIARQPGLAAIAAAVGAALLTRARRVARAGRTSTVRTATLEMVLDHDSGAMEGRILQGAFAGRLLSDLSLSQLRALAAEIDAAETQTLSLLHAYLDRTHPDWPDAEPAQTASPAAMTPDKALRILGLEAGASAEEIEAAWRRLMKRVHPDVGGSEELVAEVTAARDCLRR